MSAPQGIWCLMFSVRRNRCHRWELRNCTVNFKLLLSTGECLYEISENAFKETFSVMISILFSHDANLLQVDLI